MYEIIKNVITSGRYELSDMLKKIDIIWLQGELEDNKRIELIDLAKENVNFENSIAVVEKLKELDTRVTALEKKETFVNDEYSEYKKGKWYYKGDEVTFNGLRYVCIVPDTRVCTWSPEEYPEYWEEAL